MKKVLLVTLSLLFVGTVGNGKVNAVEGESSAPEPKAAVDLGLSVKWANMNVGATTDSDFGTYFAWGEISPKRYYSWGTYVWTKGESQYPVKYTTTDMKTKLVPSDDAARVNWGSSWRMPTAEECEELINPDNCDWEWITKDGVNGYKVTGKKTGNSIFLPITGFRFYNEIQFRAINGIYWTSTLDPGAPSKAWCLEFNFKNVDVTPGKLSSNRFSGRCIRAVQ